MTFVIIISVNVSVNFSVSVNVSVIFSFSVSVIIRVGISISIITNQILVYVLNNHIKLFNRKCDNIIRMQLQLYCYEMPKPYVRSHHYDCVVKLWTVLKQIG